jgi:formate hydrogenlyase subunit 5
VTAVELRAEVADRWPGEAAYRRDPTTGAVELRASRAVVPELCGRLFLDWGFAFAGMIVEEEEDEARWTLRYVFHGDRTTGCVEVVAHAPLAERTFPSVVRWVHAADWHEREAEDLFGLVFEGHPSLGDFVLHDDAWQEGVEPMRRAFSAATPMSERRPNAAWRPRRIVQAPGAFAMPIGPVFSTTHESVHFLLETVGEDVIHAIPRLFYKYRAIEKLAEQRPADAALLLAERFAATTAFAHALGFCHAVEANAGTAVPPRAQLLRVLLAELERLRHHVGAIAAICESTALAVATSEAAILEEDLLRASGALTGHRYLFGLAVPGGLATDLDDGACREALHRCRAVATRLDTLERMLQSSSSFLDRLEEVGLIAERDARVFGLVGPIARASGIARDLRAALPYGAYRGLDVAVPTEREGDGYARLRILFAEARESVRLMERAFAGAADGPVLSPVHARAGAALGWAEAPRGAAFHWVRLADDGTVRRYRVVPPSFVNWHGFGLSVENFAFQDFPIILATLDLSVAENDR